MKAASESVCAPPQCIGDFDFYVRLRIKYNFGLSLSSNIMQGRKIFSCIQSLIHKRKKRKRKGKKRFGNNKKTELRNSEKIAICHAFQSLQQQICVYGFFPICSMVLLCFCLNSAPRRWREKIQQAEW